MWRGLGRTASTGVPLDPLKSRLARCTHLHARNDVRPCKLQQDPPLAAATRRSSDMHTNKKRRAHARERVRGAAPSPSATVSGPMSSLGADARKGRASHAARGLHRRTGHLRNSTRRRHMRRLFTVRFTATGRHLFLASPVGIGLS